MFTLVGSDAVKSPEVLNHTALGLLRWEQEYEWWSTSLLLPSEMWLDVIVDPADQDRFEFLPRAAELFRWALENERQILAEAIRSELLELFNDVWRRNEEPALTGEDLTARMEWTLLSVSGIENVPVEFGYHAGDLFGGHGVVVVVDRELRFADVDLRG